MSPPNYRFQAIVSMLRKFALKVAEPGHLFTLASGTQASYFVDVKQVALQARGASLIADAMWVVCNDQKWFEQGVDAFAGVELGGCPLATALSLLTYTISESSSDVLYVRKAAKDHGTGALVEGPVAPGMKVVLLEDVVSTGGSSIKAIESLRGVGCQVLGVLAVVDRQMGGAAAIEAVGAPFSALTTIGDLTQP